MAVKKAKSGARAGAKGRARKRRKPVVIPKALQALREKLLERRTKLLSELDQDYRQLKDHANESRPGTGDVSDIAADISDGEMALQAAQNESGEIAQIDEALGKIEDGTYGLCEMCGGRIPQARIEVLPFVTLCVKCKEAEERGRGEGDNPLSEIEFSEEAEEE
jgi:DnaK suppressor protein